MDKKNQLTDFDPTSPLPENITTFKTGVRTFDTGANRDTDESKLDFEGFLSPLVLQAFGEYMHENRRLSDGSLRDSDNWQKGIPKDAYMKSGWRHFFDWWLSHRGYPAREEKKKALCGLLFNVQGYLHELLKEEWNEQQIDKGLGYGHTDRR